jgi:hypothetical protein
VQLGVVYHGDVLVELTWVAPCGLMQANDVDIYNIINAEEKDTGAKKRKGLALGQVDHHHNH